ncbi:MAG: ABC transporter ATP-binding protein, partial [Candidatus Brocadiia bacterium]
MTPVVEIKGLSKIFLHHGREIRALDNIDLNIEQGEFVALMGPSGSGKTTLLNIIAGIDRPTSGTAHILGSELARMGESEKTKWRPRNIGYIFQFYNLLPVLTASENVELPLLVMPLSGRERKEHVLTALTAVGLSDRMTHYPRQMSGGQEQRTAIARAIVADPKIIVADEPTGNLDAESEKEILTLLRRLNKEFSKTLIMVTHNLAAAEYADRVIRLEKG